MSAYHDVDWTLISFKKRPEKVAAVEKSAAAVNPDACPKCGKALKSRGKHLHIRACKGKK